MHTHSLDRETCLRAYQSRDPRFDGRFFIGVNTTGIFCRPVCPAPSPKPGNVDFYPSAAAAAAKGLRPCLRCRPETSPGTPAWDGTAATVSRALRLIHEGALDDASVETLAYRLGITSRQLSRLFLKHLGAAPVKVAQTRRLLFAKQLIDESNLSMADIAFTAGFGSIRRFNRVFQTTYGRAPSTLRRKQEHNVLCLNLPYRPPYDWDYMLGFFSHRGIRHIERVNDGAYFRSLRINGKPAMIRVNHLQGASALEVTLLGGDSRGLMTVVESCRRVFDLGADPLSINNQLGGDRLLTQSVTKTPGLRLPGTWDRFETLVRGILGQQVSVQAATTLATRVVERCGIEGLPFPDGTIALLFPGPSELFDADLTGLGITGSREQALKTVCEAILDGRLPLENVITSEDLADVLLPIKGIGPWTAEYVAMRGLSEPDAFPASDLGLLRATKLPAKSLLERAEHWRPWRAYAALHLWNTLNLEN